MQTQNPQRLSGHALVDYLIANPEVRGDFKYHTLRSCMWRDLLIAQPGFQDVAVFQNINGKDSFKIVFERPELANRFDCQKMHPLDWVSVLIKYPELATRENTSHFRGCCWSELLKKRSELEHLCPFEKLNGYDWINLICAQEHFIPRCPLEKFRNSVWTRLIKTKKSMLKLFSLKYWNNTCYGNGIGRYFRLCYLEGDILPCKGTFGKDIMDPATFLIHKKMDKENGRRYLKYIYDATYWEKHKPGANWDFLEKLCKLDSEEAMDIHGKKYLPFYITLVAPDRIFEKLFPYFDLTARDPGGNSLLLPALIHSMCGDAKRYKFMLSQGLDPNEKNLANDSCSDVICHFRTTYDTEKFKELDRLRNFRKKLSCLNDSTNSRENL